MSRHHRAAGWDPRKLRPIVAATLPAPCLDGPHVIFPGMRWEVGHRTPLSRGGTSDPSNLGPTCPAHNRAAGGRMGAALQGKRVRDERRMPSW